MGENGVVAKRSKHIPDCYQTLEGHTRDTLRVLLQYLSERGAFLESFCKHWGIDPNLFISHLLVSLALHDIGKATHKFQRSIRRGARATRHPHAFYGLPLIVWVEQQALPPLLPEMPYLTSSCVLGHHTQLSSNMYLSVTGSATYMEEEILLHLQSVEKWCREEVLSKLEGIRFEWNPKKVERDQLARILNTYRDSGEVRGIIRRLSMKSRDIVRSDPERAARIKAVYSYMLSLLRVCDITASQFFDSHTEQKGEPGQVYGPIYTPHSHLFPKLPPLSLDELIFPFKPYPYQEALARSSSRHVAVFAPCGRGKTEAALAWAHNICRKENRSRIVIALPTQATCNAMYDRLRGSHYHGLVGLYHGMSLTKLRRDLAQPEEQEEENDEYHYEDLREPHFRSEIFLTPVTVTTVDHLLLSFVHGYRKADFALGNLQEAVIIFDEIHNYEELTLSHIVRLFKILTAMGIPFLFMSATLPRSLVEKAKEACPSLKETVVDHEGLEFKPYRGAPHLGQENLEPQSRGGSLQRGRHTGDRGEPSAWPPPVHHP